MVAYLEQMRRDLRRLILEADIVYRQIVLPGWSGPNHGLPSTLYGYIMSAFAHIDLLSALWHGGEENQSSRMVSFMTAFMQPEREANSLAVQIWRHKLMHTGAPRELFDITNGRIFRWLLHWGDQHLPRDQHFKFQMNGEIFNMSLFGLLEDVEASSARYFSELFDDKKLQKNYEVMRLSISSYKYRPL
jgi:hypothetical protein